MVEILKVILCFGKKTINIVIESPKINLFNKMYSGLEIWFLEIVLINVLYLNTLTLSIIEKSYTWQN